MKRIVVDASNLVGMGAEVVGTEILPALFDVMPDCAFFLLLPNKGPMTSLLCPKNSKKYFLKHGSGLENNISRIKTLFFALPMLALKVHADLIFSLGDLTPLFAPCPRVVYLHQSLLLYKKKELAGLEGWSPLKRHFLARYFAGMASKIKFIVQTPVMRERLRDQLQIGADEVSVISLPLAAHVAGQAQEGASFPAISGVGKPVRFLFLSAYYPHKNHAILPQVAEELRKRRMADEVHIFTTIETRHKSCAEIMRRLNAYPDVITNLGPLRKEDVASALRSSTALLLPTLSESYGIIYLEAMSQGVPILTSDRDFSRWICGDAGTYFDPLSAPSIIEAMLKMPKSPDSLSDYRSKARFQFNRFPHSSLEAAKKIADVLYSAMNREKT